MPAATEPVFSLSSQQKTYFETFGFLHLPGIFRGEIASITEAFEGVFERDGPTLKLPAREDALQRTDAAREPSYRAMIHPDFTDRSDGLRHLPTDPRIKGIVTDLMGSDWEYVTSDANLFYSDTSWHLDVYGAPVDVYHVKISFYLDSLRHDEGAIRVIPGSHHHESEFGKALRSKLYRAPKRIRQTFGVGAEDIPSWTVETDPGDLLVWNFRTFHASFHGRNRRRSFSLMFREVN